MTLAPENLALSSDLHRWVHTNKNKILNFFKSYFLNISQNVFYQYKTAIIQAPIISHLVYWTIFLLPVNIKLTLQIHPEDKNDVTPTHPAPAVLRLPLQQVFLTFPLILKSWAVIAPHIHHSLVGLPFAQDVKMVFYSFSMSCYFCHPHFPMCFGTELRCSQQPFWNLPDSINVFCQHPHSRCM